jgi:hypothetical protein
MVKSDASYVIDLVARVADEPRREIDRGRYAIDTM